MEINFKKIIEESQASIDKDDLEILLPIIAKIQPKNILEIGAWKGYSAEVWIKALAPEKFITIELQDRKDLLPLSNFFISDDRILDQGYQYWYGTDSHDKDVLRSVELAMPSVDFLFIDGDHSYYGVEKDFDMYAGLVRKGGIIAFHDALYHADKTEEVDLYWDYRFRKKYNYVEIKAGKNSTGIGVIWV